MQNTNMNMDNTIISPELEELHTTNSQEQYGDFVEIDRKILELIGFKNVFSKKKDKHGNTKLDTNGTPVLKDMRNDFSSAIRCLRNTVGFIEGSSFDDIHAHFVVQKAIVTHKSHGGAGLNKQCLWVRKDKLKEWIQVNEITGNTKKNIYNGLVYFIHMENNMKVFKIGYTTNLKKRLESLQIAHPYPLQVYATIENVSRQKETALHQLFKKQHVRGEWFAITPDIIDSHIKMATANIMLNK
jgi:hypothetical protein